MEFSQLGTALMLGLAGAGHCLGMCGGIAAALQLGGASGRGITLAYHGGRILSYTLLGGLLGLLAAMGSSSEWLLGLRYLAAVLLIGMGLYIANWWHGIALLERAGGFLFAPVQKVTSGLLPLRRAHHGLALGLCWGLMPCGLIYSSLAWSATTGNALEAAALMLVFGIGTLPAMLAVSLGAGRVQAFLRRRELKVAIGVILILSGLWTLYSTMQHAGHSKHDMHATQGVDSSMHNEHRQHR